MEQANGEQLSPFRKKAEQEKSSQSQNFEVELEDQLTIQSDEFQWGIKIQKEDEIQQTLNEICHKNSLFVLEDQSTEVFLIQSFLGELRQRLQQNAFSLDLEEYGSFKNRFALKIDQTVDLSLNTKFYGDRGQKITCLKRLYKWISSMTNFRKWRKSYRVYDDERVVVPFSIFQVNPQDFLKTYGIKQIKKIIFRVNAHEKVIASTIERHFSYIPGVFYFIILVKLWAKARNVINFQEPMKGLSSYGVSLICMYYLMTTKQISFIDFDERKTATIDIGSIIPNLQHCEIKSLKQNFRGFLQFYSETGVFQKERRIACLINNVKSQKCTFNDNFVINMYDFIDQSNPGRLIFEYKNKLFTKIQRAQKIMNSNNKIKIRQLFDLQ